MSRILLVLIAVLALAGAAIWLRSTNRTTSGLREAAVSSEKSERAAARIEPPPAAPAEAKAGDAPVTASAAPRREATNLIQHAPPAEKEKPVTPLLTVAGHVRDDQGRP